MYKKLSAERKVKTGRREFLKGVLVTGGATALAVTAGGVQAAHEESDIPTTTSKSTSKGYHVTPHIRKYYETASS